MQTCFLCVHIFIVFVRSFFFSRIAHFVRIRIDFSLFLSFFAWLHPTFFRHSFEQRKKQYFLSRSIDSFAPVSNVERANAVDNTFSWNSHKHFSLLPCHQRERKKKHWKCVKKCHFRFFLVVPFQYSASNITKRSRQKSLIFSWRFSVCFSCFNKNWWRKKRSERKIIHSTNKMQIERWKFIRLN